MQSTLEQDRSDRKIGHLEEKLKRKSILLEKMTLRKEEYRRSNEQILDMLKQRLTQDDFVYALVEYYNKVLQDNALLRASSEEHELELGRQQGEIYDLTAARHDLVSALENQKEAYSGLEEEKSATEDKMVELQVENDLLEQRHQELLQAKDAEIADVRHTLAITEDLKAVVSGMSITELQREISQQKDNVIARQRDELIETKKLNLALQRELGRQAEMVMNNARWIFWDQHKDELRQKRLVNLTDEVELLRNLVMVKDGNMDLTDMLDHIEAIRAVKALREDWIGDLARLAVRFLSYVHVLELQLKSSNIEPSNEGRIKLISDCREGLAYHGMTLTEDEQIEESVYDDDWDAEELKQEDRDDGLLVEDNEEKKSPLHAEDDVLTTETVPVSNAPTAHDALTITKTHPSSNQLTTKDNMNNEKAGVGAKTSDQKEKQKDQGGKNSGLDLIDELFPKKQLAEEDEARKKSKLFDF